MVRLGLRFSLASARAASRTAMEPVPLSVEPVAKSQESKCAPRMTISSGFSLPRNSATVL